MKIPNSHRSWRAVAWLVFCVAAANGGATLCAAENAGFFFRDGDRIVVVGDSITVGGNYVRYIEDFIRTRFPTWNIIVRNAGINGQTAQGGFPVMAEDVLVWKPTVVVVNYGMNDGRRLKGAEFYQAGIVPYVDALLARGIRVVLCSNSPLDHGDPPGTFTGYNETFREMAAFAARFAAERGIPFVDQFNFCHRVWGENRRREKPIPVSHQTLVPYASDMVHARGPGQFTMAYIILKTLGAPAEVSYAEIDVSTGRSSVRRAEISQFSVSADHDLVSFLRTDEGSPCWIDDREPFPSNLGLELVPFREQLNRMPLVLKGLRPGRYELSVDDYALGSFSASELAAGVDLARDQRSPVFAPGRKVDAMVRDQATATYAARQVNFFSPPSWMKISDLAEQKTREFARRLPPIESHDGKIQSAARPLAHRYQLRRIAGRN